MTTNEFFEAVNNLQINDLDMYNHVQQITDDFEPQKLQMLCDDFDMFVWRKIELSKIETQSGQSLYVSDIASEKLNNEQINDLERLDVSTDDYSFDEYFDKYSYPTELKFLQRLKILLTNLTQKHIIDRNLSIENENDVVKHPFDEYAIAKIKKPQNKDSQPIEYQRHSSKGISFSVLNRIIYLTNLWHHGDESIIDKLLNRNTTDFVEISEQFKKELKRNIVLTQSDSSLKRLIKHYLFEMNELYSSQNKIENLKSYRNAPNSHVEKYKSYLFTKVGDDELIEANKLQNYILAKQEFLGIIFEVLRNNIFKTGISISQLTDEIKSSYSIHDEVLYQLKSAKDFKDHIISKKSPRQQDYINWLESDKSLEQFIHALKEHNLIEARETEAIINNHFKPHREPNSKPEPIIWLETIALLAYMIESLDQHYIKPENIWSDTAPHFSVNGKTPENLRQTANRFKQNKYRKPKNHKIIDSIIQNLPQ